MKKYNIAYVFTPIEFGGAERVNLSFLKNADRERFNLFPVVLIRPWEKENHTVQELEKEGYPILEIPVALRPRTAGRDYFRLMRCYGMLHSFLRKNSFAAIHSHGYFADILAIPASKIRGIPHISTCHGFISNDRNLKLYNRLDRIALRFSSRIIAVSDGIKRNLVEEGIEQSRVVVIQNAAAGGCSNGSFPKLRQEKRKQISGNENDLIVGYVGRLSPEKGIPFLLEAIRLLRDSGMAVKALIIGDGPLRDELKRFVKENNMEKRVTFTGFQTDVESWLPAMDIFVLPSLSEGTPMSLLEAMAQGIPVIASAVGGVPQVIDPDVNGILVPPAAPEELKKAIERLHLNPGLRRHLSLQAKQKIQSKYDLKKWTNKIEQEYIHVIRSR